MKQIAIIILVLTAIAASAQDKPATKASDKPIEAKAAKEAPAEITIPAEDVKKLKNTSDAAELALLRWQNLGLQIEQAQARLKQLKDDADRARDEANAAIDRAKIKAGAPGALVGEYVKAEVQKDGSWKIPRTPQTEPPKQ